MERAKQGSYFAALLGFSPLCPHLLMTQLLKDEVWWQRELGMKIGLGPECADRGGIPKKPRKSERKMTTPLFLLRCVQLGISIADLDLLTIGLVNDMFTERQNDDYPYKELASQSDFDHF